MIIAYNLALVVVAKRGILSTQILKSQIYANNRFSMSCKEDADEGGMSEDLLEESYEKTRQYVGRYMGRLTYQS